MRAHTHFCTPHWHPTQANYNNPSVEASEVWNMKIEAQPPQNTQTCVWLSSVVGYTDAPCYAHDITASSETQWRQETVNKRSCSCCVHTQARKLSKHFPYNCWVGETWGTYNFSPSGEQEKINLVSQCTILSVQFEQTLWVGNIFNLLTGFIPNIWLLNYTGLE